MKKLFTVLPLVFLLCITFSCQKAEEVAEEPVVDVEAYVEAIKGLEQATMKAFNEGGLDSYISLFVDDAVWMPPGDITPHLSCHRGLSLTSRHSMSYNPRGWDRSIPVPECLCGKHSCK